MKLGISVRVMRNVLKLRGTMLFGKYSMYDINMKVSNRGQQRKQMSGFLTKLE